MTFSMEIIYVYTDYTYIHIHTYIYIYIYLLLFIYTDQETRATRAVSGVGGWGNSETHAVSQRIHDEKAMLGLPLILPSLTGGCHGSGTRPAGLPEGPAGIWSSEARLLLCVGPLGTFCFVASSK